MMGMLLTSVGDVDKLGEFDDELIGIACYYPIVQLNESIKLEYLFDNIGDLFDCRIVGELASNWHRDHLGNDIISESDIMVGASMQSYLLIDLSNMVRYYFAIKACLDKYDKIFVSENIPRSLSNVLQLFEGNIVFFSSENHFESHISVSPSAIVEPPPVKKYFSSVLRFIQMFFIKLLKNKVLVINDWTFRKIKNNNVLNINKFNP